MDIYAANTLVLVMIAMIPLLHNSYEIVTLPMTLIHLIMLSIRTLRWMRIEFPIIPIYQSFLPKLKRRTKDCCLLSLWQQRTPLTWSKEETDITGRGVL